MYQKIPPESKQYIWERHAFSIDASHRRFVVPFRSLAFLADLSTNQNKHTRVLPICAIQHARKLEHLCAEASHRAKEFRFVSVCLSETNVNLNRGAWCRSVERVPLHTKNLVLQLLRFSSRLNTNRGQGLTKKTLPCSMPRQTQDFLEKHMLTSCAWGGNVHPRSVLLVFLISVANIANIHSTFLKQDANNDGT